MNMIARDIMTHPVVTIRADAKVKDAAALMANKRFSGLPVVDDDGRVIGMITEADLIRFSHSLKVVPIKRTWGWVNPYEDLGEIAGFREGLSELENAPVTEVMSRKVITVLEDTPVIEIARMMTKHAINRVPVIGRDGRLVGIVTRADMVRAMARS